MHRIIPSFYLIFFISSFTFTMEKITSLDFALQKTTLSFRRIFDETQNIPLLKALTHKHPFKLLDEMVAVHQNKKSSWNSLVSFDGCKKALAAWALSRQLNKEIYASELTTFFSDPRIDIDEHLNQFDDVKDEIYAREWAIISSEYDLQTIKTNLQQLRAKLPTIIQARQQQYGIVDSQPLEAIAKKLKTDQASVEHALEIIKERHALYELAHDPLSYLEDESKCQQYSQTMQHLYPLAALNETFAENHDGQTLLHGCCSVNLPHDKFSRLLSFLTQNRDDLGINQPNKKGQRLLDYAKEIKLDNNYITTIKNLGGKSSAPKALRWSSDTQTQEKSL